MKQIISTIAMVTLSTLTAFAGEAQQTTVGSVYTDLSKDCVVVAAANEQAPIDFYTAECKAFGGFQLTITGGDLRYHPELSFGGAAIVLDNPYTFHDMASNKVEWMYRKTTSADGSGSLQWIGFIYRLSEAKEDGSADQQVLRVVRLDGAKTCSIGSVATNEQARALVLNAKAACK